MGLFENLFKKQKQEQLMRSYFDTLTAYQPVFTSFEGGMYEMAITRAAIDAFATHVSKLKPEVMGSGNGVMNRRLQYKPNPYMDTTKFLYRLATIYAINNTAFISPLYDRDMLTITGYYPLLPSRCEVVEHHGIAYLRYAFANGKRAAIELEKAGILTKYQFRSEFFGESNHALDPVLQLIHTQNEGIVEGVKNSASIRFLARLANTFKDKTIEEERKRFTDFNLANANNTGVMMFDAKYAEVKQIESKPWVVSSAQMKDINENVYNYFGVNQKILQNSFNSAEWGAFYEGKIEPFAVQLSLVMTNMTFSDKEIAYGNRIIFTANRLQYASNEEKLAIVTQLFDRGFLTHNQGLEIFNMAPVEGGDKLYIRKEYTEADKLEREE